MQIVKGYYRIAWPAETFSAALGTAVTAQHYERAGLYATTNAILYWGN
jgi:hypothetical protein